jgi:hypothetical protein
MEILNDNSIEERTNTEHLNLLSIFYFVFGGLSLFGAFILLIYILIFGLIFSNHTIQESIQSQSGGEVVGSVFGIISVVFIVIFIFILTVGILQIIAGFKLRKKRSKGLIMLVAILELLSFPLGTTLGVFTIIIISRSSVAAMFDKEIERMNLEKYGPIG